MEGPTIFFPPVTEAPDRRATVERATQAPRLVLEKTPCASSALSRCRAHFAQIDQFGTVGTFRSIQPLKAQRFAGPRCTGNVRCIYVTCAVVHLIFLFLQPKFF